MNKMYVVLAASVVGLTVLSGCGKDEAAPTKPVTPPPATPAATPAPTAAPTAQQATDQAKSVSTAMTTEAQKLIADATTYIKDKKFDLAEQAVKKLEDMKPQLPAEYGPKIDQLRTMLNTAKSAGGIKIPGM